MNTYKNHPQETLSALAQIEASASRLDPPSDHLLMSAYMEYAAHEERERKRLEQKLRALTHEFEAVLERFLAGYQDAPAQPTVSSYLSRVANDRDAA